MSILTCCRRLKVLYQSTINKYEIVHDTSFKMLNFFALHVSEFLTVSTLIQTPYVVRTCLHQQHRCQHVLTSPESGVPHYVTSSASHALVALSVCSFARTGVDKRDGGVCVCKKPFHCT